MKHIEREDYLNRLIRLRGTPDIKIITGLRRSGKSELVRDYVDWLEKNDNNVHVLYVDFMDLKNEDLKDYKSLYKYVENQYQKDAENIVVIDEVQLCNQFELAINSLYNSRKYLYHWF